MANAIMGRRWIAQMLALVSPSGSGDLPFGLEETHGDHADDTSDERYDDAHEEDDDEDDAEYDEE